MTWDKSAMAYALKRGLELGIAAIHVFFLKLLYGFKVLDGPVVGFGAGFNLAIRNGGALRYGKINVRRDLSVFCDGGVVTLGDGVFFNNHCSLNCMSAITVGRNTLFGEMVKVYDHDHVVDQAGAVNKGEFEIASVEIGQNCWIGASVVILKGVTICDGVTIGSGAVVSKSIGSPGVYIAKEASRLYKVR